MALALVEAESRSILFLDSPDCGGAKTLDLFKGVPRVPYFFPSVRFFKLLFVTAEGS